MGKWIIIPDVIISAIKDAGWRDLEETPTPERLEAEIQDFVDTQLEGISPGFYADYKKKHIKCTSDKIKCAINQKSAEGNGDSNNNGVSVKKEGEIPHFLDLLCYYAKGKNWIDTLLEFNINESDVIVRFSGKEIDVTQKKERAETIPIIQHVQNIITNNQITERIENTIIKTQIEDFSKSQIQIIDSNFWKAYVLPDNKKAILSRYYTHADSSLVKEVIANDEAVPPNDFVLVSDSDGNVEQRTITETIKSSGRYGIFLLKIILEGGVGKTTFLHWIAKHFHDSYNFILISYLGSLDIRKIILQARLLKKQNGLPISLLLDNISDNSVSKQFERLIREIKAELELSDTLFIIAERESRYQSEFIDSNIEMLFGGNVLNIVKVEVNREILFEKIYAHLLNENPNLRDQSLRKQVKTEFLNKGIQSISESIYHLIKSLKLRNVIKYVFDWEDWGRNKFEKPDLKYLYAIVACFYQFGIKVPTGISTKILGYALDIDIVNAINRFGGTKCPLQLTEDARFLSLKHEHLANWFLSDQENKKIVMSFFRTFVTEIDSKINAKLLRKIRKVFKRDEFEKSILINEFNLILYINIIENYIELPTTNTDEKIKMLMEQGIAYNLIGKEKEAINSFNAVLEINKPNNYANDQLARIYFKSPQTYSLAFSKYYEIYRNDGHYAFRLMHSVVKKCNEEKITLDIQENLDFSATDLIEISKLCIEERHFDQAIQLLNSIPTTEFNYEVPKLYSLIAHYIPYSSETILKKKQLFLRAIEIKNTIDSFQSSYNFEVDYCVFLYRTTKFTQSTVYLRSLKNYFTDEQFKMIVDLYISKIRVISKFFFGDIPEKENINDLKIFLYKKCKKAAQIINRNDW